MANSADLDQMSHSAALNPVNSGNFFHWNLLVFHYITPVYHDNQGIQVKCSLEFGLNIFYFNTFIST